MTTVSIAVAIGLGLAISFTVGGSSNQAMVWLLTPLAALLPLLGYNWWFHSRHRRSFGAPPKPISQIVADSVMATAIAFTAVNAFIITIRNLGTTVGSLAILVGAAVAFAVFVPHLVSRSELGEVPAEAAAPFVALAEWAGVRCNFALDQSLSDANARAVMVAGKQNVVVSNALLAQPAELQSLVVAHEIAHLKHGHLSKLRVIDAARAGSAASLAWLVALAIGDSIRDQGWYPALAFGLLAIWWTTAPVRAFVLRHFERQADAGGYELLGTVSTNLGRQLYARQYSNLEPSVVQKLFSNHPPPAERLEMISRLA